MSLRDRLTRHRAQVELASREPTDREYVPNTLTNSDVVIAAIVQHYAQGEARIGLDFLRSFNHASLEVTYDETQEQLVVKVRR